MLYCVLLSFFVFTILPPHTRAEEGAATGQNLFCLNAVRCDKENSGCRVKGGNDPLREHRARLTVKPGESIIPDTKTYIFECFAFDGQTLCTTGNKNLDQVFFGEDRYSIINKKMEGNRCHSPGVGYEFEGLINSSTGDTILSQAQINQPLDKDAYPLSSVGSTLPPLEWQSCSASMKERQFKGFNLIYIAPQPTVEPIGEGEQPSQKLGTFVFDQAANPETDSKTCVGITWDPYGRVFDSQTLEPILGANVQLLKKRSNSLFTPVNPYDPEDVPSSALTNPYKTKDDGFFSFIVPDGTYKLALPSELNPDFALISDISIINPSYAKIYSDIYPASTGEEIIQKGSIQHRDIPIDTKGKQSEIKPAFLDYFYDANHQKGQIYVYGRVNLPFTKLHAFTQVKNPLTSTPVRSRLLSTQQADKMGKFEFVFDTKQFSWDEYFGEIELEKVDLKTLETTGITMSTPFEPIFPELEGIAYDTNGYPLPNTKVEIYLPFGNKPATSTTTDANGHFSLSSNQLPFTSYSIRYKTQQGDLKIKTSDFFIDNADYLTTQKKNLNISTALHESITNQLQKQPKTGQTDYSPLSTQQKQKKTTQSSPQSQILILIIIIFLLLVTTIMFAIGYSKNKKPSF